ncbi:MAG: DNA phosphorothioation system sulfurtransferase DndC [Planctomycetes bacterium]|nr:DNA phosphorothioation system sulfurtransferase DndC [Planctomycetota bacterium]
MTSNGKPQADSAFTELGLQATIDALVEEVQALYLVDSIPWVVGYSGGKDSTATLQLVWLALQRLPAEKRHKPVHVISTDTLVENPVVSRWVTRSLQKINESGESQGLPIRSHQLTPQVQDTFWVNLIGRGYPVPGAKFRWCTERMKIKPANRFISGVVKQSGEAIVVLGTRKAESSKRKHRMTKLELQRVRDRLSPNLSLPNSLVYSPIEDWSNDDVWIFLMQVKNPWGYNNKDLLTMYQGASADGECPLVLDTSTPSCGDSRFGCWVCTLVEEDKSMSAMVRNDEEKHWMRPLLHLRNKLKSADRSTRDFRRMSGQVQLFHGEPIPGPYKQAAREQWVKDLLEVQEWVRTNGPEYVRDIELITMAELHEIRRIWVVEKHEFEDSLPSIYKDVTGRPFPGGRLREHSAFGAEEVQILREACAGDELHFELVRELLSTEQEYRTMARRAGLFEQLEKAIRRGFYEDAEDAKGRATRRAALKESNPQAASLPLRTS